MPSQQHTVTLVAPERETPCLHGRNPVGQPHRDHAALMESTGSMSLQTRIDTSVLSVAPMTVLPFDRCGPSLCAAYMRVGGAWEDSFRSFWFYRIGAHGEMRYNEVWSLGVAQVRA